MNSPDHTPHIVVVGGGFAGISAVKTLLKRRVKASITLISDKPSFEYYPGLYKLVTGSLAVEVSVPLAKIFHHSGVTIRIATYESHDPARQCVRVRTGEATEEISYDYLVLALGSVTNYFGIPGLPEHSFSFKSVSEALRLKRHFCQLMTRVKQGSNGEAVALLHVVIVGAGPSGVELAGDLKAYLVSLAKEFAVDPSYVTIDLIEGSPRVLNAISPNASAKADARLRSLGVNIFTNRALERQDLEAIAMPDMNMQSHTVVWTAGTKINEAFAAIPGVAMTERKRVRVSEYLTVPGDNHVFVAGDGAGTARSGLAQTAIYDGAYVGNAIARMLAGRPVAPYKPGAVSYVIPIGSYWALWSVGGRVFTGFLPWLLRSAIDFKYFSSILPLSYVLDVIRAGRRYRKEKTYCPIDASAS